MTCAAWRRGDAARAHAALAHSTAMARSKQSSRHAGQYDDLPPRGPGTPHVLTQTPTGPGSAALCSRARAPRPAPRPAADRAVGAVNVGWEHNILFGLTHGEPRTATIFYLIILEMHSRVNVFVCRICILLSFFTA